MAEDPANLSLSERLLHNFYEWERRGRGWDLWPEAVQIEPLFRPFPGHHVPPQSDNDDGRRSTVFSRMFENVRSWVSQTPAVSASPLGEEEEESVPEAASAGSGLVEFEIALPMDFDAAGHVFEAFLLSLSYCRERISFEILGDAVSIRLILAVDESDAAYVDSQLVAHFPDAVLSRRDNVLLDSLRTVGEGECLVVDFGLSREFMLPLRSLSDFKADSFVGLIAALSNLRQAELGAFQIIFAPVMHPWAQSISRSVTFSDGSPFFDDAPEFLKLVKEKISKPLFAAVVRIAAAGDGEDRVWEIARGLTASLSQFGKHGGNELIPLQNDEYDDAAHIEDFLERRSHRSGFLLNSGELASFVHLPGRDVVNPKLSRLVKKTKAAPQSTIGHVLVLGTNTHNGKYAKVSLSAEDRVRHMHVIGASGTGKSTFLLNLIMQDIEQGNGLGVLDPHGDLIDQIISRIPEHRINGVVLVDPADADFPIGFNILSAHSDLEKTLLASDLVGIFRRFATSWGNQMGSVLGNAVLAFLESNKGGTLSDLRRFLIEPSYRNEFLTSVTDPEIVYYWRKEFPLLSGAKSIGPLLTRLDTFLRPKPVRYMVSQNRNSLDISHIMDSKKIFLCKLAQGAIGEENAFLLGSLLVSKFHQLTLGRQSQSESLRTPFTLYCDEFGGYVTPSMARLLSGARKYRLGLVLSHQELRQLNDPDVQAALSNAGTRISFRVGDSDAKTLANDFASFDSNDLKNLQTGEAIAKVGRSQDDFNLQTEMLENPDPNIAEQTKAKIIELTHTKYATPRNLVEEQLARSKETDETPAKLPVKPKTEVAPVTTQQQPVTERKAPAPENLENVEEVAEVEIPKPVPPTPPLKKPRAMPPAVAEMGKGGKEHKYYQQLLAQWAQGMGYRATIEMPVEGGSIDVVLEKESRRIACEISVTSTVEQEMGNLKKCLAAGFGEVWMIGEGRALKALQKSAAENVAAQELAKAKFLTLDEIRTPSAELLDDRTKEETVRGLKVRRHTHTVEDAEARRRAVAMILMRGRKEK